MGSIKAEVLKVRAEINRVKARIQKYRLILTGNFYWGGALLLLVFVWIIFPPENDWLRLISNSSFLFLLLSLWISYRIISKIKSGQQMIGELRIKLKQLVLGEICDCPKPCNCRAIMEKELAEEYSNWSDGILAEVEHEV